MATKSCKQPSATAKRIARIARLENAVGNDNARSFKRRDHVRTILEYIGDKRTLALYDKTR